MKNRLYGVVWAVLSGALLTACQTMPQPEDKMPIPLRFEGYEASATKTAFGEKDGSTGRYPVLWSDTDQIAVTVNTAAAYQTAAVTPSSGGLSCTFSASLVLPEAPFGIQAVSPASAVNSFDGAGCVGLNIPAVQTPAEGSPDALAQLLVAETTIEAVPDGNIPLQFHHATAYGCLSLSNLPTAATVRSVDIIASVPLSGKWIYDFSAGTLSEDVPANIITLQSSETTQLFFGCAPADLQGQSLKIRLNTDAGVYERTVDISAPLSFKAGTVAKFTVDMSSAIRKTSIKMITFASSFAVDANWYVPGALAAEGYDEISTGVMYIGSCSLERHVNEYNNSAQRNYTYYKNTTGNWTTNNSKSFLDGLQDEEWDYIVLNQNATVGGVPGTYTPYLEQLVDIVRTYHPKAKLLWSQLWAVQQNYTGSFFKTYYSQDQMTMYNAIMDACQDVVLPMNVFGEVLPAGTAMQNLRTSFFGDTLTRDGWHASYREGRFVTALSWARVLGGSSVIDNSYKPDYEYTEEELYAIRSAAEAAYWNRYTVTSYCPLSTESSHAEDFVFDGFSSGEHFVIEED